jgi:four helix bundle protein
VIGNQPIDTLETINRAANKELDSVPSIQSHRDLIVWQKAMDLAVDVYALIEMFPTIENYRMSSQLARAVVSVAANIAEGRARSTRKDFANFLGIAQGSLAEAETYILLAVRLGYVKEAVASRRLALLHEVGRMLTTLRKRLSPR